MEGRDSFLEKGHHPAFASSRQTGNSSGAAAGTTDEFALILSSTPKDHLSFVLQRILEAFEKRTFFSQGQPLTLTTITAGGSEVNGHDKSELAVFKRADTALCQVKKAGRNRAVVI